MEKKGLGTFQVSFILVGTIMGAGFASGREIWTYFGVFGIYGYIGLLLSIALYIFICLMATSLSKKFCTTDFGKIVSPSKNEAINNIFGYILALVLCLVLVTMTAAGGSICSQQFGISKVVGGLVVLVAVLVTVLGDFDRISKVFRYIMPFLMTIMVITCVFILLSDIQNQGYTDEAVPSPFAKSWYFSSITYMCFNIYGTVPICMITAKNARSERVARKGIILGGTFIGVLALLLLTVTMKDPCFSQAMDMPLLAYSQVVSKPLNLVFTITLILAIYAAACSNYYGFIMKLKDGKNKKIIIVLTACICFLIGLVGFKNIVSYAFSLAGILGILILILMIFNYCKFILLVQKRN